ncbi:protein tyrosine phosphatase [Sodalis sp. RH22]|uniref:arsenate reductase/protein-tyrosine-phosphatase family protein n=1 Tax=unclassified Sodalis (in: enterobacteria) TaxID=2636512 RepID=UPI0039B6355A
MFDKILVVCVGNICRSPIGERLLKKYIPDKAINSAGIHALVDHEADAMASMIAKKYGLSLEGHKARQISVQMCREHDLILVMEKKHIDALLKLAPDAQGKIMLFGHWNAREEIADPYRKNAEIFDIVYRSLDHAAQDWVEKINS